MATRSVKFEISIEKLSVKFEGDIQMAEQMQTQITGAINNLASAQNRLLSGASSQRSGAQVEAPPRSRRRRRRGSAAIDTSVIDAEVIAEGSTAEGGGDADDGGSPRRRTGAATTALITSLKGEGFFGTKKTLGAVREALSEKGHSLKSSDVSPILVRLTQDGVLKREKNAAKQWVYYAP